MTGTGATEIRLVNDIAAQFGHLPDDRAAEETANHVRKFWDPMMMTRLIELAAGGATDLGPVARAAVLLLHGQTTAAAPPTAPDSNYVSVRTANGRLEVDVAAPQTLQGLRNALGVDASVATGDDLRAAIERVTARWTTAEALLALDQEDVPARAESGDTGLVAQ